MVAEIQLLRVGIGKEKSRGFRFLQLPLNATFVWRLAWRSSMTGTGLGSSQWSADLVVSLARKCWMKQWNVRPWWGCFVRLRWWQEARFSHKHPRELSRTRAAAQRSASKRHARRSAEDQTMFETQVWAGTTGHVWLDSAVACRKARLLSASTAANIPEARSAASGDVQLSSSLPALFMQTHARER